MITREMIEGLFEGARAEHTSGKASWDIDQPCLWSFFFVDPSREKLVRAGKDLEKRGYTFVGFLEPGPEDDDQESIFMRVDRVERHTVDSLLARNDEFYAFAREFALASYDGMDCGAVDGP